MGKALRSKDKSLPKKMLGAWVPRARKAARQQMNLKENFIQALKIVIKGENSDEAPSKKNGS